MHKISRSNSLSLQIVASGMHLSDDFGRTIDLIGADGFQIDGKVDMLFAQDSTGAMAKGIGVGIYGFTQCFEQLKPDVILVQGDRVEPFSAAIAGSFLKIAVAHIHGGDKAMGGFDEYMRPTITRFSHLHFTATEKSRQRVIRLGEREEFVFMVGSPALDELVSTPLLGRDEIEESIGFALDSPFLLVLQHPVSTQPADAGWQMRETMEAVKMLALPAVILYPNSDAGSQAMVEVIKAFEDLPFLRVFKNLERERYLTLLASASALVGNSSSGIVESSYFKVPFVNVGIRQHGRERSSNVLDIPHDRNAIFTAVQIALSDPEFQQQVKTCVNPYGDGKASERIVDILSSIPLDQRLLEKQFMV